MTCNFNKKCSDFLLGIYSERFRERLGVKVVKALKRSHNGVVHAAVDMLCALMCVSILLKWLEGSISINPGFFTNKVHSCAFPKLFSWPFVY